MSKQNEAAEGLLEMIVELTEATRTSTRSNGAPAPIASKVATVLELAQAYALVVTAGSAPVESGEAAARVRAKLDQIRTNQQTTEEASGE